MAVKAELRPVSAEECADIAMLARQSDIDEIESGLGIRIEQALIDGIRYSRKVQKIVVDDKVLAVVGDSCYSVLGSIGVPWMITTIHTDSHKRAFLEVCPGLVDDMLTRHSHLLNYVDDENQAAVRWLKWLGFEMGEPEPYGGHGHLFRKFTLSRKEY